MHPCTTTSEVYDRPHSIQSHNIPSTFNNTQMSIPIVTIPEAAFDAALAGVVARRRSRLFQYFLRLTNSSATFLIIAYLVGFLGIKPLLETRAFRRLDLLESTRLKLRDLYLKLIGKVDHIPIVALHKPGSNKLYAEAVCQTQESRASDDTELNNIRTLGSEKLHSKLGVLNAGLKQCTSFSISEVPSYRSVDASLKQFQQKVDSSFFSHRDLFFRDILQPDGTSKDKNMAQDAKREIRGIKGLFMSGQVY